MCLSFLDNSLGAHELIVPHFPSRDPLYLCCRTPSAKDAAPPGAITDVSCSKRIV